MLFLVLVLTIIASIALYLYYRRLFGYWSHHASVPSVKGRIFSGNFFDFLKFKTSFFYHLKTIYDDPQFTNAPVVGIYGLYKPSLLIREPELIKSMLIKDFDCFRNRCEALDTHWDPIGAQMMFFADYSQWKEMRSNLSQVFTSGRLKTMYPLIQGVGENLDRFLSQQGRVQRVEMKDLCARYTTDVICTTVFGFQSNAMENPAEQLNQEMRLLTIFNIRRAFHFLIAFFVPQLTRLLGSKILYAQTETFLRAAVSQALMAREESGEKRNDLIDIFAKLKQEAEQRGADMQKFMECLMAQAGIFMVGGFETSSTTLSNCLLELAKQPTLQRKLKKQIDQAFEEGNGEISYEAINKMEFLDMIVYETLRLYPVLPVIERKYHKPRDRTEAYSLRPYCDFSLPEGMPVFISVYALHYDSKYWSNPTHFDPERFSSENKLSINPMVHLPFGHGPHNCIGLRLGMLQVKAGLLYLLKNHFVRVCDETVLQPEFEPKAIVLQVKGGIYLEIVKDNNDEPW